VKAKNGYTNVKQRNLLNFRTIFSSMVSLCRKRKLAVFTKEAPVPGKNKQTNKTKQINTRTMVDPEFRVRPVIKSGGGEE